MGQKLGQHFLREDEILDHIVEWSDLSKTSNILEIGPGEGYLTVKLSEAAKTVTAIELDHELVVSLSKKFSKSNVSIKEASILDFNLDDLSPEYSVVANIPYYLTSKLVRMLTEANNKPKRVVLLIQKEVAERLAAKPGKMSLMSVSAQLFADIELGRVVKAEEFDPPPKVASQLIKLKVLNKPRFQVDDKKFFRLVKAGFSERRKKLNNSLSGSLSLTKEDCAELIKESDLSEDVRAQELSLDEWYNLYKVFLKKGIL